jgi:transcription initiation factor IIE alpha subunit
MKSESANRLHNKTSRHAIQVELQSSYNLSPIEAQVLAQRVQQLVDEQAGFARQPGQITYQALAITEPAGKPLEDCQKVPVHLTVMDTEDINVWDQQGSRALRRLRVHRIVYEARLQGGALSQEDVACVLGLSLKSIKRIFAYFREQGEALPSRGEIQDMGGGVSHKVPVIRRYIQDLSFSRIARELGNHGIPSMARYLHHFALVMVLEDRDLTPQQMCSIIGISENLIQQYRQLYAELNVPEYQRTLERLKQTVFQPPRAPETPPAAPATGGKGGAL